MLTDLLGDPVCTNGARVNTSFATSMDARYKVRTAPELKSAIRDSVGASKATRALPKYVYPRNLISPAMLGKVSSVQFGIPRDQCGARIGYLDAQKPDGKKIFGGGYLIGDAAAESLRLAEIRADELKFSRMGVERDCVEWRLSEGERRVIQDLTPCL